MSSSAITVENLSKSYRLGLREKQHQSFRDALTGMVTGPLRRLREMGEKGTEEDTFWALKDVNFEVKQGEVVGIIGRNGAGKSTLLKVLSRIVEPTSGRVKMRGRVASLLEVGTGFHPELSGRENIYMNGSILGMRKAEIDRKFDEIVAFAEVERFLDTPVKRYSSGMYVRLAFAVAAHLEPEILIVDEVLAVGDAEFQKKCLGKMQEVSKGSGRTVLFVSHNIAAIRSLCSTCAYLQFGRVQSFDSTELVVHQYAKESGNINKGTTTSFEIIDTHEPRMMRASISSNGQPCKTIEMGDPISIAIDYAAPQGLKSPRIGLVVSDEMGSRVLNANNRYQLFEDPELPMSRGTIICSLGRMPLMPGRYFITLYFGDQVHDSHVEEAALAVEVTAKDLWGRGKTPPAGASSMWWPVDFKHTSKVEMIANA